MSTFTGTDSSRLASVDLPVSLDEIYGSVLRQG
jgi:hypothetical protein